MIGMCVCVATWGVPVRVPRREPLEELGLETGGVWGWEIEPELLREKRDMMLSFFFGAGLGTSSKMEVRTGGGGGGGTLLRKSMRLSSCRLGLGLATGASSSSSSSLKSMAYGSLTRRVLRFGIMSSSSSKALCICGGGALTAGALTAFL